jgi:hypothetical protein
MADAIHISTARTMLNSGEPVSLKAWKRDGSIMSLVNCIGLQYDFRTGTRNVKILASGQIRKVRDVCIFEVNNLPVYL